MSGSEEDTISTLEAALAERDAEVGRLVKAFSHYHEAKYDDDDLRLTDQCKKCGLDIRNDVHIRTPATEEKPSG